jgi:hypothetical protein
MGSLQPGQLKEACQALLSAVSDLTNNNRDFHSSLSRTDVQGRCTETSLQGTSAIAPDIITTAGMRSFTRRRKDGTLPGGVQVAVLGVTGLSECLCLITMVKRVPDCPPFAT